MSTVPTYEVFTKKKLVKPTNFAKTKKRLRYRTFKDDELKQLDEVLHNNNMNLEG